MIEMPTGSRHRLSIFSRHGGSDSPPSPDESVVQYLVSKLPDSRLREREHKILSHIRHSTAGRIPVLYLKKYLEIEGNIIAREADPERARQELRLEVASKCSLDGTSLALRSVLGSPADRVVFLNCVFLDELLQRIRAHFGEETLLSTLSSASANLEGVLLIDGEFHMRELVRCVLTECSTEMDRVLKFRTIYERILSRVTDTVGTKAASDMFRSTLQALITSYGVEELHILMESLPSSIPLKAEWKKAAMKGSGVGQISATVHTESIRLERDLLAIVIRHMKEGVLLVDAKGVAVFANMNARSVLGLDSSTIESAAILGAFARTFPTVNLGEELTKCTPLADHVLPNVESQGREFSISFHRLSTDGEFRNGTLIWLQDRTETREEERKKNDFISLITHQLRTPLSGIKWALLMFIRGDLGELTNEQKVFLMKSYESNQRMMNLVDSILLANELVTERYRYTYVPTQINDLCENILYEIQPSAKRKQINLEFPPREQTISKVMVDAEKMRSVIQNLLENAIRYTPPSGKVTLNVVEAEGRVTVSVSDSGIGIPKNEQQYIFKQFFRAANVAQGEGMSGSGLGLFIARSIIEKHNGTIWFESEEGKGTTFKFSIPLIPQNAIHG